MNTRQDIILQEIKMHLIEC